MHKARKQVEFTHDKRLTELTIYANDLFLNPYLMSMGVMIAKLLIVTG